MRTLLWGVVLGAAGCHWVFDYDPATAERPADLLAPDQRVEQRLPAELGGGDLALDQQRPADGLRLDLPQPADVFHLDLPQPADLPALQDLPVGWPDTAADTLSQSWPWYEAGCRFVDQWECLPNNNDSCRLVCDFYEIECVAGKCRCLVDNQEGSCAPATGSGCDPCYQAAADSSCCSTL